MLLVRLRQKAAAEVQSAAAGVEILQEWVVVKLKLQVPAVAHSALWAGPY
jgi:hypothetical protein